MLLAHVLTASGSPVIAWVPAVVGIAAVNVAVFGPRRLRRSGVAVAVVSLAGLVLIEVLTPGAPASPGYRLTIATPPGASATTPLLLVACATGTDGSRVDVPGADRILSVSVDGTEVLSTAAPAVVLRPSPGAHTVRVEVLTRDHVEYRPPVVAQARITVTGPAPLQALPTCP